MYNTNNFLHFQIYHDKALYNKGNVACLKVSFQRVFPIFPPGKQSKRNASARENHPTREKRDAVLLFSRGVIFTRARVSFARSTMETTCSLSRRASALLRNIRNIRIYRLWEKKPIVSVTYENKRISLKNSLPY